MPAPRTRYARSGDVNIAYQVLGDGPLDLVYVWEWVSHLDFMRIEPTIATFLQRLGDRAVRRLARSAPGLARIAARSLNKRKPR